MQSSLTYTVSSFLQVAINSLLSLKIKEQAWNMPDKNKPTPPQLTTSSLHLRGINKADSDDLFAIYADAKTLEYWGRDPVQSPAEAWNMIKENMKCVDSGSAILWGIALRKSPQLIGTCTIFRINQQNRNGEIGYILNRAHWGKGLMTEAIRRVLAYAFDELKFHRLEADTDPENLASLALLEKLGFQREGYFRERWFVHGKWHDSIMLGLLRNEYPKN
jgi:RimJ/RimL family protein N-acetyltransferase